MTEINGFSSTQRAALHRDEDTSTILKRDTKANVDVKGSDPTLPMVKKEQQGHVGVSGAAEWGHVAFEGVEIVGGVCLGASAMIAGSVIGFGLGVYALHEAHEKGAQQRAAIDRDNVHVALLGTLDLPNSYKQSRMDGYYAHVPREGKDNPVEQMTKALNDDPNGRATLQLHADRGMHAARDMVTANMDRATFFKAHPKLAEAFAKDPAFQEGFRAYEYVSTSPAKDDLDAQLDARDLRYTQSQINVRG